MLLILLLFLNQHAMANSKRAEKQLNQQEIQSALVQMIVMRGVAKATGKLSDKVKSCDKKTRVFKLNQEDNKRLIKYGGNRFFTLLSMMNLSNQCHLKEDMQLETEMIKTQQSLKLLSLFPQAQKVLKSLSKTLLEDRNRMNKETAAHLLKFPPELVFYLKKRTTNKFYEQTSLFSFLEKYIPIRDK